MCNEDLKVWQEIQTSNLRFRNPTPVFQSLLLLSSSIPFCLPNQKQTNSQLQLYPLFLSRFWGLAINLNNNNNKMTLVFYFLISAVIQGYCTFYVLFLIISLSILSSAYLNISFWIQVLKSNPTWTVLNRTEVCELFATMYH